MRAILVVLLSGVFLLGCKHAKPSDAAAAERPGATARRSDQTGSPRALSQSPRVTPLLEPAGTVAAVNPTLRFVVIDFNPGALPKVDQRLSVYRDAQKVGEVKISAQARNNIVSADIVAGQAKVGDEVRAD